VIRSFLNYSALTAGIFLLGCERPVTEPVAFARLCGPEPTIAQAEQAALEHVAVAFTDGEPRKTYDVRVEGRMDRRLDYVGKRVYGWKITFYAKTNEEAFRHKYTGQVIIMWNNGTTLGAESGHYFGK
jgi:hypothetical protein